MTLHDIPTPACILDRAVLSRNARRMAERMTAAGVRLRPHMKTAKSVEVARIARSGHFGGIAVSTLREAEYFAERGIEDITYAVGPSPEKVHGMIALNRDGAQVRGIVDSVEMARLIVDVCEGAAQSLSLYIDVDTGYTRSGVLPESDALIEIARVLDGGRYVQLAGVLTHAGQSYDVDGLDAIRAVAEAERAGAVRAAERIRSAGIGCAEVSIGSTPTCVLGEDFSGVTEVRPGNYMFFDLSMAARGVSAIADIAVSVLTSVIVRQAATGRVLIDAGALALSKDTGVASDGYGYGLMRTIENGDRGGCFVAKVSQEQGWLASGNTALDAGSFAIGERMRVLPNHSCMTAAAYDQYYVVDGGIEVVDVWERCNGW